MKSMKYSLQIQQFANNLEYAKIFSDALDKVMIQELVTGWTEINAKQVKYTGGDEVKIPDIDMSGLTDYDRNTGFTKGTVNLKWRTHKFRFDRGAEFNIDAMDVDETNWQATAANVMGEFARTKSVPEVDLIRLSTMAQEANNQVKYTATTPAATYKAFKDGVTAIRKKGYTGELVAHVTYDVLAALELEFKQHIRDTKFTVGGVDTTLPSIDKVALIATADDRMRVEIDKNETTKIIKGKGAVINMLIVGKNIPLGITKHNPVRNWTPAQNQEMDAYKMQYRLYHDLWVLNNKKGGIYLAYTGTLPVGA